MKLQASPTQDGSGRLRSVRAARRAAGVARRADGTAPSSAARSVEALCSSRERATNVLVIAAVMTVRKPIPNSITAAATSRPATDSGTLSPYPTVVVVWTAHQSPDPIDGYRSWSVTVISDAGRDGDHDRRGGDHDGGPARCRRARHPAVRAIVRVSIRVACGVDPRRVTSCLRFVIRMSGSRRRPRILESSRSRPACLRARTPRASSCPRAW